MVVMGWCASEGTNFVDVSEGKISVSKCSHVADLNSLCKEKP